MGCFFSLSLTVSHTHHTLAHRSTHPCAHFYTNHGRGAGRQAGRRGAGRFKGGLGVASCAGWLAQRTDNTGEGGSGLLSNGWMDG